MTFDELERYFKEYSPMYGKQKDYPLIRLRGNGYAFIEDLRKEELVQAIHEIKAAYSMDVATKAHRVLLRILLDVAGVPQKKFGVN